MSGLIVIGSGPAGLAAARSFRTSGGRGPIRLVTEDDALPYHRPPLSKDFLRAEVDETELAVEPASFFAENAIQLVRSRAVRALDATARMVTLDDGSVLGFDACVLATGSSPRPLSVPGGNDARVHYLRSLAQARHLRDAAGRARTAVVIGSGFIGCEAAVSLARRDTDVTLVTTERWPQQGRLGADAGTRIAEWLKAAGVDLVAGTDVRSIEFADDRARVRVADTSLSADLVLACTGVAPRGELAGGLGTDGGRILVDTRLRTTAAGVYAAGDVAAAENARAGRRLTVEHWSDAETMGAIAGANAAGHARGAAEDEVWDAVPGFWSEIGDHTLKYHAWGDGFDDAHLVDHADGAFTVWYARDGVLVGVLTHDADDDYDRGEDLIAAGASVHKVV